MKKCNRDGIISGSEVMRSFSKYHLFQRVEHSFHNIRSRDVVKALPVLMGLTLSVVS